MWDLLQACSHGLRGWPSERLGSRVDDPALGEGGAGGQDNPIELGDGSSSESSRAETMLTLLRNVQRRYAQARGQRD